MRVVDRVVDSYCNNGFVEIDVRAYYSRYLSVYGVICRPPTGFYDRLTGVNKHVKGVDNSLMKPPFDSGYLSVSVLYTGVYAGFTSWLYSV